MKRIIFILLLSTLLFSEQKQIILGSFLQETNALKAEEKLRIYIDTDKKLQKLVFHNALVVERKKAGKYAVVTLSPFGSYVQLLRTLDALKPFYDDAYVLSYPFKLNQVKVIVEVPQEQTIPVETIEEVTPVEEVEIVQELATISEPIVVHEKVVEVQDDNMNLYILLVIGLVIVIAIGFLVYNRRQRTNSSYY